MMNTNMFQMSKSQFEEAIVNDLTNALPGYTIKKQETIKENDTKMTGLSIYPEGGSCGCVIYVEHLYYDRYCKGESLDSIVSGLSETIKNEKDALSTTFDKMFSDDFLSHVVYRMANKNSNKERLMDALTKDIPGMNDIVIYPVWEVRVGTRNGSVIVTNTLLQDKDVTAAEVHAAAEENTTRRTSIISLDQRLREMVPEDMMPPMESPFLVSYDKETNGEDASILGAPSKIKALDGDYYIIPSSTHELLFLPKSFEADVEKLKNMVREVNTFELDPKDILSYNVYEWTDGHFITHEANAGSATETA